MAAESSTTPPGSRRASRRTVLLAGGTGFALADILAHQHLSLAGKKNTHKKCN